MARFRLELGPVPLHHQVYLDLRRAPRRRRWRAGRPAADRARPRRPLRLQPDHRPARARELVREGRIERTRGRGTFVLRPRLERDIAEPSSFTAEMQAARPRPRDAAHLRPARVGRRGRGRCPRPGARLADPLPRAAPPGRRRAATCSSRSTCRPSGSRACSPATSSTARCTSSWRPRYGTRVVRAREALEPVLLRAREARLLGSATRAPRPCSSRASRSPPTASRSSSAGRSSAAIAPATTSNARSTGRSGRPAIEATAGHGRSGRMRSSPVDGIGSRRRRSMHIGNALGRLAVLLAVLALARRGLRPARHRAARHRPRARGRIDRAVGRGIGRGVRRGQPVITPLPVTGSAGEAG